MNVKCGKRHETLEMKEPFTCDKELEKRVEICEEELSIKESYSTHASKTTFKSGSSRHSFCICKPGDKESCIDALF